MAQKRTIDVQFPRGGLSKRFAFQQQPPFTTVDAANTRPEGVFEKRLRGGSRPGLVKSFATRDSDNPVRLLTVMRSLNVEGRESFEERFGSALSETDWGGGGKEGDWMTAWPGVADGRGWKEGDSDAGAILKVSEGAGGQTLSTTAPYSVECRFDPSELSTVNGSTVLMRVYAKLANTTPVENVSVYAEVQYTIGAGSPPSVTGLLRIYVDGAALAVDPFYQGNTLLGSAVLHLDVDGDSYRATWTPDSGSAGNPGHVIANGTTASTGKRVGFYYTDPNATAVGFVYMDDFVLRYIRSGGAAPPEAVVQATNGILYREDTEGGLTTVTQTGITLASDRTLLAVDRLGKLYIADHGNRIGADADTEARQTDGAVTSANADRLTSATIDGTDDDWTEFGIEPDGDWLEIMSVATGSAANKAAAIGLHKLAAQANAAYLELASALSIDGDISGITFRVTRGAKVYDSDTGAMTRWEPTAGNIPLGCPVLEVFSDRAAFGGDPEHTGIYYMSRSGDFDDFNYGASVTDRTRAFSDLTTTSDGGQLSIPISAIAAITEDYCLFSAESELYLLRGDPTLGGIMGNISSQIGIGSRTAWCRIPDGSAVFLSRDGLYRFHPSQPFPESLSRDKVPLDLIDVVQNTSLTVTLEYDVRFQGVHIYITPLTSGFTKHYWFDWAAQGFWLVPLAETDHEPFAITYDAKANHVLLGCRDGYIRHYDAAASTDDGTAINSHVLYGPFSLGGNVREGAISDLYVVLDDASGDAVVEVFVGDDAESAYKAAAFTSRTISAGYSNRLPIRARGAVAFVKISDSSGSQWAIDSLTLVTQRNGRHRS